MIAAIVIVGVLIFLAIDARNDFGITAALLILAVGGIVMAGVLAVGYLLLGYAAPHLR